MTVHKHLSIKEKYNHLLAVLSSERFLTKQGLGNEVPYFIYPYPPDEAIEIEKIKGQLVNKLDQKGINVLNINLYDLVIKILKENNDWDWYLENEQSMEKEKLKEELQSILDVETVLIPAIAEEMKRTEFDMIFLSGVGEVFPYIRSHNVLNNMQSTTRDHPVVIFFPGNYIHSLESGASLDLFDRLHDDKYYRAFNLLHYEI